MNQGNTKRHTGAIGLSPLESNEYNFNGSNYEITFINLSLAVGLCIALGIVYD